MRLDPADPARLPPQEPQLRARFSTSHLLATFGFPPEFAMQLITRGEDLSSALARLVGSPLPAEPHNPIRIRARAATPGEAPQVRLNQGIGHRQLVQEMDIVDAERIGAEEVLESLAWLLANRYAYTLSTPKPSAPPEVPDWFAAGIVRESDPALRFASRNVVAEDWTTIQSPRFAEVLSWRRLPSGPWRDKSWCAAAIAWLRSGEPYAAGLAGLLKTWSRGEHPQWNDPLTLEARWDVWIADWLDRKSEFELGTADPGALEKLLALAQLSEPKWALLRTPSQPVSMDVALAQADQDWVAWLAQGAAREANRAAAGRDPETQQLGAELVRVFSDLACLGLARRGRSGEAPREEALRREWREVEQAILHACQKWRAYGERLETLGAERSTPHRAHLQRMLDAHEKPLD